MPHENAQLTRNEECRREVRAWLANRPTTANEPKQIRRSLFQIEKADWSIDEICAALGFLLSREHVAEIPNGDGATRYYQITAAGILVVERGGV